MTRYVTIAAWGMVMAVAATAAAAEPWPQYEANPFVIELDIPGPEDSRGGMIVADITGDGRMDYLVTVPDHIAAYANDGRKLWVRQIDVRVSSQSENNGLPGHNGPGVTAADINGDGAAEVLFLTHSRQLHVASGESGETLWQAEPPHPEGAERWEHLVVADFRGEGDRDVLLQATNADGYRVGHYIAGYALADLEAGEYEPLWSRDDFLTCAHNGARVADLDGDGRHEVLGGDVISPEGELLYKAPVRGHLDAIAAHKVRDDIDGLQVVAVEEGGGQRVFVYNHEGLIWEADYREWEPQNFAAGEFDPDRPGKEIWNRSRYNTNQRPFVFDAHGELINQYEMADVKPDDWTDSGVEIILPIHWSGEATQQIAATERHTSGDVAVFDGVSGEFAEHFEVAADRLHVADVSGDWREEIIVLSGYELRIYHNAAENPNPERPRLWEDDHYRRNKLTRNYYSP